MRVEFQIPYLDVPIDRLSKVFQETVAQKYQMTWRINAAANTKRIALLASKHDHALLELLWRHAEGKLEGDVVMVISNHADLQKKVSVFDIPFHHIPVTAETKSEAEQKLLALLASADIDVVVLARYMQILSSNVVQHYPNRIINIHHSFLPAFMGADPYQQALDKGVKIIGATAHYVTDELDMGPIIEQDIVRVSHRESVIQLRDKGRDIERVVLARALEWHLEDRIIVDGNKTIVFS